MTSGPKRLALRADISRDEIDDAMLELGLVLVNVIRESRERPGQFVARSAGTAHTVQFVEDRRLDLHYAIVSGSDSSGLAGALEQRLSTPGGETEPRRRLAVAALSNDEATALELLTLLLNSEQRPDRAFACVVASYFECVSVQRLAQQASLQEENADLRNALVEVANRSVASGKSV